MASNDTDSLEMLLNRTEYSPGSPSSQTDPNETCPKRLINENLIAIKSELSQSQVASPANALNESFIMSQIPNQEFYLKLDKTLEGLPKDLYIDELILKCNNDYKIINWYRQALADRARKFPDCPNTKLVTRRTTTKRNGAYKSAEDCSVLQCFIDGERTGEIQAVFCSTNAYQSSMNESIFLTPRENNEEHSEKQSLTDKISVPETLALLTQIQREVADIKRNREEDVCLLNEIRQEVKSMAITYKLMYASINSIKSALPSNFFDGNPGTEQMKTHMTITQRNEAPSTASTSTVLNSSVESGELNQDSSHSVHDQSPRTYRDALITQTSDKYSSVTVGNDNTNTNTSTLAKKGKLLSNEQRSKAFMNTKQRNASSVSTYDDEVIVIDDAICEINLRPAVDTSESKKSKGDKSSNTFMRKRLPYVSEAGRSQNSDNDNDVFIGVSKKRVVGYYVSNIDKASTYSGFLKFLKSKGVYATQVKLFYHKYSISAKLNIPAAYCELVESEDFWPDEMRCRKWMGKSEWDKEREVKREEYERRRRVRFEREEREEENYSSRYTQSHSSSWDRYPDRQYHSGKRYTAGDTQSADICSDDDYDNRRYWYDRNTSSKYDYSSYNKDDDDYDKQTSGYRPWKD